MLFNISHPAYHILHSKIYIWSIPTVLGTTSVIHPACLHWINYAFHLSESIPFSKATWKTWTNCEMGTATFSVLLYSHWKEVREGVALLNALSLFPIKFSPASANFHLWHWSSSVGASVVETKLRTCFQLSPYKLSINWNL